MSYAALAEQGRQMAQQYGYRPRPIKPARKAIRTRKSTGTPRPAQTATEGKYALLCATILETLERTGKMQKADIPARCFPCAGQSHHEFLQATKLLKNKIQYDGHAPFGYWRLK